MAKTFACPLAVFIFDNLPSKPRPTVAIFAKSIINALPPSLPLAPCPATISLGIFYYIYITLGIFYYIYPHALPQNSSGFVRSHLSACQSTSYPLVLPSLGASPAPPCLLFNQSALQDILSSKNHKQLLRKIWLHCLYARHILICLYSRFPRAGAFLLHLAQSLPLKTLPLSAALQWHRQHYFAAIRRECCQQRTGF